MINHPLYAQSVAQPDGLDETQSTHTPPRYLARAPCHRAEQNVFRANSCQLIKRSFARQHVQIYPERERLDRPGPSVAFRVSISCALSPLTIVHTRATAQSRPPYPIILLAVPKPARRPAKDHSGRAGVSPEVGDRLTQRRTFCPSAASTAYPRPIDLCCSMLAHLIENGDDLFNFQLAEQSSNPMRVNVCEGALVV